MVPIPCSACLLMAVVFLATPAQGDPLSELRLRATEATIIHRHLCLNDLQRWQPEQGGFIAHRLKLAPLQVLHLWAVDCQPCVDELPLWRDLQQGWVGEARISFLFVSETIETEALHEFLVAHRSQLPSGPLYRVTNPVLRRTLGRETRPITLLVDAQGVIRHAIAGSIVQRRSELIGAMERLLAVLDPPGGSADEPTGQRNGCM